MTQTSDNICAQCTNLTTKGYPEQMAAGKGRCTGHDVGFVQLPDPFVAWNTPACIHFDEDQPGQEARNRWIEKRRAIEQNNNEVPPKTKG